MKLFKVILLFLGLSAQNCNNTMLDYVFLTTPGETWEEINDNYQLYVQTLCQSIDVIRYIDDWEQLVQEIRLTLDAASMPVEKNLGCQYLDRIKREFGYPMRLYIKTDC